MRGWWSVGGTEIRALARWLAAKRLVGDAMLAQLVIVRKVGVGGDSLVLCAIQRLKVNGKSMIIILLLL